MRGARRAVAGDAGAGMTLATPNMATWAGETGRGPACPALGCRNGARWILVDDELRRWQVCRLHANKAERSGSLKIEARDWRQMELVA